MTYGLFSGHYLLIGQVPLPKADSSQPQFITENHGIKNCQLVSLGVNGMVNCTL